MWVCVGFDVPRCSEGNISTETLLSFFRKHGRFTLPDVGFLVLRCNHSLVLFAKLTQIIEDNGVFSARQVKELDIKCYINLSKVNSLQSST